MRRSMARSLLAERMIIVGALRQGGEIGQLFKVKLVQRLAEIVERGGGDAIGVQTEEYLVEIELDDLVLGEGLLDALHQQRFLQLAFERALVGQEEVLGDLLGDGGGADDLALAAQSSLAHSAWLPRRCPSSRGRHG